MRYYKNKDGVSFAVYEDSHKVIITDDWMEITEKEYTEAFLEPSLSMDDFLRNQRIDLLKAFDIYKSNVSYGIVQEDYDTNQKIVSWYYDLLDLKNEAFENIPNEIKRYL